MDLTKQDSIAIRNYIHRTCGIDLAEDKEYLIHQRLEPVAIAQGCRSFQEFAVLLRAYEDAVIRDQVVAAITTNETSFFRDTSPFEFFRSVLLPQLHSVALQRKSRTANRKGSKVSVLSAGSSSGQEPYSLSIAIHDYVQNNAGSGILPNDFVIVATDISSRMLAKAVAGEYSDPEISRGLSDIHKAVYFHKEDNLWVVKDQIRSIVEFRRINLIEPFTFLGGFDVIFCRNVLIYFDISTRQKIIDQFYDMLPANGILVLGSTENVYGVSNKFESRYAGSCVYYVKTGGERNLE